MMCSLTGVALVSIGHTGVEQAPCQNFWRKTASKMFQVETVDIEMSDHEPADSILDPAAAVNRPFPGYSESLQPGDRSERKTGVFHVDTYKFRVNYRG
jgi:hypothetical protein